MVFIDETWVKPVLSDAAGGVEGTNMTRTHGWYAKGAALIDKVPYGHWKTLTRAFAGAGSLSAA